MATTQTLLGLRVAILVADGFEQVELTAPREALLKAGANPQIVSPEKTVVQGFDHLDKADHFTVDVALDSARASDFDALLLPGGIANPDRLRTLPRAVAFVREFFDAQNPVCAICHGPWSLVEAGLVEGRTLTSWPSLQTDIRNAGGTWIDRAVVIDGNLVTSRKPEDIPTFNDAMLALFAQVTPKEPAVR
jgi:protease I